MTAIGGLALTVDIPLIRLSEGDTWSVLAVRRALTFVAAISIWLLVWAFTKRRPTLIPGKAGLVVMSLYSLSSITFMLAVFSTSTANLVFILAFNTMFAALLAWVFLGERPPVQTFITMVVMMGGVALIVSDGIIGGTYFGDAMALMSALLLASAITISRSARTDMGFAPLMAAFLPALVGLAMVGGPSAIVLNSPWWLVFNGMVVMPLSFWCLGTGPKYISGPEVAMFYLLETVLAPIWVWLVFSEVPTRNTLIGGSILIMALVAHSIWQLRRVRRSELAAIPAAGL